MKSLNIIFVSILIILTSCREDSIISTRNGPGGSDPTLKIEKTYHGFVFDQNGDVLEGAQVSFGEDLVLTDEFGYFRLKEITSVNVAYLKVQMEGFFDAYATVNPTSQGVGYIEFKLIPKSLTQIIQSSTGGIVNIGQSSSVDLVANAFIDENGQSYNGAVYVFAHYIDPSGEDFYQTMPGDLQARNQASESVVLESFGMIHVELEGTGGENLNISEPAKISTAIPQTKMSSSPQEIPLWYFDETEGIWIEEGKAQMQGTAYVGEVGHFSLWNCDVPWEWIQLSGKVVTPSGCLANTRVEVEWVENNEKRTTMTDSEGAFEGALPTSQNFILRLLNHCDDVFFEQDMGFLQSDFSMQIVLNEVHLNDLLHVDGILRCDGANASNAYSIIRTPETGQMVVSLGDETGIFNADLWNCGAGVMVVQGINLESSQMGNQKTFQFNEEDIMTGDIETCEDEIQYTLEFHFDSSTYSIDVNPMSKSVGDSSTIYSSVALDFSQNGFVEYIIQILDWNNDFSDPILFSIQTTPTGDPDQRIDLTGGSGIINAFEFPEYYEFDLPNVTLEDIEGNMLSGSIFLRAKKI